MRWSRSQEGLEEFVNRIKTKLQASAMSTVTSESSVLRRLARSGLCSEV